MSAAFIIVTNALPELLIAHSTRELFVAACHAIHEVLSLVCLASTSIPVGTIAGLTQLFLV